MNFNWVKVPKSEEEEKEQFDTLYHFLSKLSNKEKKKETEPDKDNDNDKEKSVNIQSISQLSTTISSGLDEFTRLKLDLLSNFQSIGVGITPLQQCSGCDRSFYSESELEKHLEQSDPCQEWVKRKLKITSDTSIPFFSFLEMEGTT